MALTDSSLLQAWCLKLHESLTPTTDSREIGQAPSSSGSSPPPLHTDRLPSCALATREDQVSIIDGSVLHISSLSLLEPGDVRRVPRETHG